MKYDIIKRTFEAKKTNDLALKSKLNEDARTSEYMTSYKYILKLPIATYVLRSKSECIDKLNSLGIPV